MTDSILVPRDLTAEMRKAIWDTQHDTCEKTWAAILEVVEAQPASEPKPVKDAVFQLKDVGAQWRDISKRDFERYQLSTPFGSSIRALFTRPAPAGVVLPERKNPDDYGPTGAFKADGWNEYRDEYIKLNGAAAHTMPAGIVDRIEAAMKRVSLGQAPMRIPADQTDVDLVLAECLGYFERLNESAE